MNKVVKILKAYLTNDEIIDDLNADDLIIFKEQSLLQYLYPVFKDKKYKAYYLSSFVTQQKFISIQSELTILFNTNEIPHFYVKGSVLYKLFPDIALRSRGDIDVFVAKDKIPQVMKLLKNNGYILDESDCMHHLGYNKNNLSIEVHFSLFDDYADNPYLKVFNDPFSFAVVCDKYLYELKKEYHFVYCICHFANHLKLGAGMRYILDFYYMLINWNLDYELIHKLINELQLNLLYENILNCIYTLTCKKLDDFPIKNIDFMLDYLVNSGIHGNGKNNDIQNKIFTQKRNKVKYILARLFMTNKAYRLSKYPKLGLHFYTYPLCFIHHTFYLLTHKLIKFFKLIFKRKNKEDEQLYKRLGI